MPSKLLVVDDDMDTLRLVELMLERQGFEVLTATGGRQAVVLAKSELPNLILLDVMMPDVNGLDVLRKLRAHEDTAEIPIILFTAKSELEDKLIGFEVGADDYLTKPARPRELIAHINAVLARAIKTRELKPLKTPDDSS
jgi:DNA-binding response OmpR family regulator